MNTLIDLRGTEVLVDGQPVPGQDRADQFPASLSLFFDPTHNTAFFKLRLRVGQGDDNSVAYILIEPEQVVSLCWESPSRRSNRHDASNQSATAATETRGGPGSSSSRSSSKMKNHNTRGNICLRFTLQRPGSVWAPHSWPPTNHAVDMAALSRLYFLAGQLTISVHLGRGILAASQVQALCATVSTPGLVTSNAAHANRNSLLGGRGRLVEDVGALVPHHEPQHEPADPIASPPSYDDGAASSRHPPPPPPPCPQYSAASAASAAPASKKRPRRSSSSSSSSSRDRAKGAAAAASAMADVKQTVAHLPGLLKALVQGLVEEAMVREREKLLHEARLEARKELDEALSRERDSRRQLESRLRADIDNRDQRLWNKTSDDRWDLEDLIRNESRSLQEKLLDHLEDGMWTFQRS